jgi:hypothetical protein
MNKELTESENILIEMVRKSLDRIGYLQDSGYDMKDEKDLWDKRAYDHLMGGNIGIIGQIVHLINLIEEALPLARLHIHDRDEIFDYVDNIIKLTEAHNSVRTLHEKAIIKIKDTITFDFYFQENERVCPMGCAEPSKDFKVNPNNGIFYCYSCKCSGDILSYISITKHISFNGAVAFVFEKYKQLFDQLIIDAMNVPTPQVKYF